MKVPDYSRYLRTDISLYVEPRDVEVIRQMMEIDRALTESRITRAIWAEQQRRATLAARAS